MKYIKIQHGINHSRNQSTNQSLNSTINKPASQIQNSTINQSRNQSGIQAENHAPNQVQSQAENQSKNQAVNEAHGQAKTKQITSKQFVILVFLVMVAQKMFMLPSLMIRFSGRDSYLSVVIFILIEIAMLMLIMCTAKLSKNRTFYGILNSSITKIGGKIVVLIMLAYLFLKLMLLFGELRVFFNNSLSEPLDDWLALLPLCFLLFLTGTKSLRGIGRLGEILVLFVAGAMALLILLVAANIDLSSLMPFLENGLRPALKNVYYFPMWFCDLPLLMIALGEIEFGNKERGENKKTATGRHFLKIGAATALAGGLMVLFFCVAMFSGYGDISDLIDYSHNISNMLLYSSSSYIYGRFDVPVFCVWVFSVLIELTLVFYSFTRHISYITEYKNNKVISFLTALCAYFAFIVFFKSDYVLINFSTSWVRIFAAFNTIAVPLLLFFAALILRKRDVENNPTKGGLMRKRIKKQRLTKGRFAGTKGASEK